MTQQQFTTLLKPLRVLIILYLICATWFMLIPDSIPDILRDAERTLDKPLFEKIDSVIVILLYMRTLLCIFLWTPTRIIAALFCATEIGILFLTFLTGPHILSASDAFFDTAQTLAEGGIITILFLGGFFVPAKRDQSLIQHPHK